MLQNYHSLGLMSGSSLDGLDVCYSRIAVDKDVYSYKILSSETIAFPERILGSLINCRSFSSDELKQFNFDFGQWAGKSCRAYLQQQKFVLLILSLRMVTRYIITQRKNRPYKLGADRLSLI